MLQVDTRSDTALSQTIALPRHQFELTLSQTRYIEPIVLSRVGQDIKITGGSHHGEAHDVALRLHDKSPDFGLVGSGHLVVTPKTVSLRLESAALEAPLSAFKEGLQLVFPGRRIEVIPA